MCIMLWLADLLDLEWCDAADSLEFGVDEHLLNPQEALGYRGFCREGVVQNIILRAAKGKTESKHKGVGEYMHF